MAFSGITTVGATGIAVVGAAAAAAGRASLAANGGGWRTTSSGTDTLVAGDGVVEYGASCTVTLPSAAASGVFIGKTITLIAATAGIVLTLTRAGSDTLNDGTSTVAVTMGTVRSTLAVVAQSASAWGSLQPGSLTVNAVYAYLTGSVAYAQSANIAPDGTITAIGSPVAATTADPTSFLIVGSGANISYPTGIVGSGSAVGTVATRWTWSLSALGITLPSGALQTMCNVAVASFAEGARGGGASYLLWGLGTGATAPTSLIGVARGTSGTTWNLGYLQSTLAGNSTGTAGVTRVMGVRIVGDSTNTSYALWRYEGTDMSGSVSVSGPSVTTTPTHIGIYAVVEPTTTVGSWTVNAPIFTMRWNVL